MKAWIKASRIPAQLFIFPSLLLGQAMAYSQGYMVGWEIIIAVHLYGVFMHLFIVYANDYADYETDRMNDTYTPFTGGSRVLVDELLQRDSLKKGVLLTGILTLLSGVFISLLVGTIMPVALVLLGMAVFQMYSFPPVNLSYRGFGESLQVVGVGIILPLIGYGSHTGTLQSFAWAFPLLFLPAQYAMALSTSLPDAPSDKKSGKRTSIVILGPKTGKSLIILLYTLSFIGLMVWNTFELSVLMILLSIGMILGIFVLNTQHDLKPGSKQLTAFVGISVAINTTLVLSTGIQLLIGG